MQAKSSIENVTNAISTHIIPQIGEGISQIADGVQTTILPKIGSSIETIGQGAAEFLPRINTVVENIGGSVQNTVGIGEDIRNTTIPTSYAVNLIIHLIVFNQLLTEMVQMAATIFLGI